MWFWTSLLQDANLDYHPYANSDFHAEQKILPNPEDNYAQIQKRRPPIQQEPYHTPPAQYESYPIPRAADTEQCYHQTDNMSYEPPYSVPRDEYPPTNQALLIQVPPPKPGRSAERIDHGYAPENIGPGYAPDRVYASQSDEQLHVSRYLILSPYYNLITKLSKKYYIIRVCYIM